MSKAVKLKNNLYLDTRGIVHNKKILNTILFPIGYVYLSVVNTNPGTIFGGTWESISGYYLYAGTGGTKTDYTGIGTRSHTLTAAQSGLPKHAHTVKTRLYHGDGEVVTGEILNCGMVWDTGRRRYVNDCYEEGGWNASSGHSHNIATYQLYAWKRVS